MKTILFDFNRTLYDPELDCLLPDAEKILQTLKTTNFRLCLLSKNEKHRKEKVNELMIDSFFEKIYFVDNKTPELIRMIFKQFDAKLEESYVIGDYLPEEIRAGNLAGAHTIWLQQGKFQNLSPTSLEEVPEHTIRHLSELLTIVQD